MAGLDARRSAAAERVAAAEREQTSAEAQLATLVQVQAAADENAPLDAWLARRLLGTAPRLWQKVSLEARGKLARGIPASAKGTI